MEQNNAPEQEEGWFHLDIFSFNKGLPLSIRTAFYPLIGERIYGWAGNVIDILATVATLFGVATSLGQGLGKGYRTPALRGTDRHHRSGPYSGPGA